jgi:hypothetical protein
MQKRTPSVQTRIRRKIAEYFVGIADEFKRTSYPKTARNCFGYLNMVYAANMNEVTKEFEKDELKEFGKNPSGYLRFLDSFRTFGVWLSNNEIKLK